MTSDLQITYLPYLSSCSRLHKWTPWIVLLVRVAGQRFHPLSLCAPLLPDSPNSSICMCCHWDWWLKQQRRERCLCCWWEGKGKERKRVGEGRGGGQSKEARRWLRDFEALPPLVASLPACLSVCVADNLLTPHRLIRHLCWSQLGSVTLRPDPDKDVLRGLAFELNLGTVWEYTMHMLSHVENI